jgi:hypothetical protein
MQASLRLDRELSEIEVASLRAHSRRCVACASFARELAAVTRELRAAPPERPAARVAAPRRRSATVRVLQLSAAAAAVVLAAGLGSLAGFLSSPRTGAPTTAAAASAPLHGAALIQRGLVAPAPVERLPATRIRPAIPL